MSVLIGAVIVAALVAIASGRAISEGSSCPDSVTEPPAGNLIEPRRDLVPQRHIRTALLCRYQNEINSQQPVVTPGMLAGEATVGTKRGEGLARRFNKLPRIDHPGDFKCPDDSGARVYVVFYFAGDQSLVVRANLTGCEFITGRGVSGAFEASPRLIRALIRMTP